jgi:hypothetical protein
MNDQSIGTSIVNKKAMENGNEGLTLPMANN